MNTCKIISKSLSSPSQLNSDIEILILLETSSGSIAQGNLIVTFNPQILQLTGLDKHDADIDIYEETFSTGIVPIEIKKLVTAPKTDLRIASLYFKVIGGAGESSEIKVDAINLTLTDGTKLPSIQGTAAFSVEPQPFKLLYPENMAFLYTLPTASNGKYYYHKLKVQGGVKPLQWKGYDLPDGLELLPEGVIKGWIQNPGTLTFEAEVLDNKTPPESFGCALEIPTTEDPLYIEPMVVTDFVVNQYYSTVLCAKGGKPPYRWKIKKGWFPKGIEFNANGVLQGKCKGTGTYNITLTVTDSANTVVEKSFVLKSDVLYGQKSCGKLNNAYSMLAIPNIIPTNYYIILDVLISSSSYTQVNSEILISGESFWKGYLKNGTQSIILSEVIPGPHIFQIKLQNTENLSSMLILNKLTIANIPPTGGTAAKPIVIEYQSSNAPKITNKNSHSEFVLLPGCSDHLMVSRPGGLEVLKLTTDGCLSSYKAFTTVDIKKLVCTTNGLARGIRIFGGHKDGKAIEVIRQEKDASWSTRTYNSKFTFNTLSAADVDYDNEVEALLGTDQGVVFADTTRDLTRGPLKTNGAAGKEEITDIIAVNKPNSYYMDTLVLNRFGQNLETYSGNYLYTTAQSEQKAVKGQPFAISYGEHGPYSAPFFAVACPTVNSVEVIRRYYENSEVNTTVKVGAAPIDIQIANLIGDGSDSIITADKSSNTISVINEDNNKYSSAQFYSAPKKITQVTAIRNSQGRVFVIALGEEEGELTSWTTNNYAPACQIAAICNESLVINKQESWISKPAALVGNSGSRDLVIHNLKIQGRDAETFGLLDFPPFPITLNPGKVLPLNLVFVGSDNASNRCTVEAYTNDPVYPVISFPVTVSVSDKGIEAMLVPKKLTFSTLGQNRRISICNISDKAVKLSKVSIRKPYDEIFLFQNLTLPINLSPSQIVDITIKANPNYFPQSCGKISSVVCIEAETDNRCFNLTSLLELSLPSPWMTFSPPMLNFGAIELGKAKTLKLNINNQGSGNLYIRSITKEGSEADSFKVNITAPMVLSSNESRAIDVTFTADKQKDHKAVIKILSNDMDSPAAEIQLFGTAVCSNILAMPTSFNLSYSLQWTTTAEKTLSFCNYGPLNGEISSVRVSESISIDTQQFPAAVAAGTYKDITFTLTKPNAPGKYNGFIEFTTNASNKPSTIIRVEVNVTWSN